MAVSDTPNPELPTIPPPFGQRPLRTFALGVALPALLLYVLSAGIVVGALLFMARDIDAYEDGRGVAAMHAAVDGFLNDLSSAVSDEGTWNEAYLNVVVTPDPAWMDSTWGSTARAGLYYDAVVVTDASGAIVFGEDGGGPLKGEITDLFPAAAALLAELDKGIGATGDATTVSGFAADGAGTAGLAAISIHQSTPGGMTVARQIRRVLWIVRHMTPDVLQDISSHFQLPLAALVDEPAVDASSIQLSDAQGHLAGTLAWIPDRAGSTSLDRTLLAATALLFGLGLALAFFLGVLRRAMLRRASAIAQAQEALAKAAAELAAAALQNRRGSDQQRNPAARLSPASVGFAGLEAIRPSAFTIEYQPIFDLRAEALVGVEALLRWQDGAKDVLAQESIEPAALGALLSRVGTLAIRHAASELAPFIGTTLTIAVAAAQLLSSDFAEKLLATLASVNLPARRLQLALDCNQLSPETDLAGPLISLRQAGAQIALDRYVPAPPAIPLIEAGVVDRARLSPELTGGVSRSQARHAIVASTIEALRAAGLSVSAPGVTDRGDVASLLRLGCTEFQGAVFAPPLSLTSLTQLLLAPPAARAG